MNDFRDTLLIEEVRDDAFWGAYVGLEDQEIPTEQMLFNLQVQNLRGLERSSGKQYQLAHEFIETANSQLVGEDTENYVYGRLLQLLNVAFQSAENNIVRNEQGEYYTAIQRNELADAVVIELHQAINALNLNDVIPANLLDRIEAVLRKGFAKKRMTMAEYRALKADLAEQIMVDFLNKNPLYRTIQTGAFQDSNGKQIIEDAMTFTKNVHLPIAGSVVFYDTSTGKDSGIEKVFNDLQDFLTEAEKASKQGLKISLSDEFYETLQQIAALSTQAKSGATQDILNRQSTGRNAMSLADTKVFSAERLWQLYTEAPEPYFEDNAQSQDLMALANYALSQAIGETTLSQNQLYYTTQGFVTASEWMEVHKRMLAFNPGVDQLTPDMLNISRPYAFKTPR